jgi:hypothetical protein
VSTFAPIGPFLAREKSQLALFCKAFLGAFQAYDEGSIPFTRSNLRALRASVGKPTCAGLNRGGSRGRLQRRQARTCARLNQRA